jgi:prepilin-type N-terminal cleavage/methylation domain-containing protein
MSRDGQGCKGFSLLELIASLALCGILLSTAAGLLVTELRGLATHRRAESQRMQIELLKGELRMAWSHRTRVPGTGVPSSIISGRPDEQWIVLQQMRFAYDAGQGPTLFELSTEDEKNWTVKHFRGIGLDISEGEARFENVGSLLVQLGEPSLNLNGFPHLMEMRFPDLKTRPCADFILR